MCTVVTDVWGHFDFSSPPEKSIVYCCWDQPHVRRSRLPRLRPPSRTADCVRSPPGYYVPNDDGEFYQFCYVTYKGEIRGASTPFLFRAKSPSEDELLTVEDECNSDILVVTTKAGFLEVSRTSGPLRRTRWHFSTLFSCLAKSGGGPQRER